MNADSAIKERRFEIAVLRFVGDCKSPLLEVDRKFIAQ